MKRVAAHFKRTMSVALAVVMTAGLVSLAVAQDKPKTKDPNERKKKDELKSVYKRWLDEDVIHLQTRNGRHQTLKPTKSATVYRHVLAAPRSRPGHS